MSGQVGAGLERQREEPESGGIRSGEPEPEPPRQVAGNCFWGTGTRTSPEVQIWSPGNPEPEVKNKTTKTTAGSIGRCIEPI